MNTYKTEAKKKGERGKPWTRLSLLYVRWIDWRQLRDGAKALIKLQYLVPFHHSGSTRIHLRVPWFLFVIIFNVLFNFYFSNDLSLLISFPLFHLFLFISSARCHDAFFGVYPSSPKSSVSLFSVHLCFVWAPATEGIDWWRDHSNTEWKRW